MWLKIMKNEDIKTILDLGRKKQKKFLIRWEVTRFCNYSCDFCIQGSQEMHLKASRTESASVRKEIAIALASFIEHNFHFFQTVSIRLIGGEVTALPDFKELLLILVNSKFRGRITSRYDQFLQACIVFLRIGSLVLQSAEPKSCHRDELLQTLCLYG